MQLRREKGDTKILLQAILEDAVTKRIKRRMTAKGYGERCRIPLRLIL